MDAKKIKTAQKKLTNELKKYDSKKFKVMFYVMDTKGKPNGHLKYIYTTAKYLKGLGYNVCMLYEEKDFVGVGEWMGKEYSSLPHFNVVSGNVDVSPADLLFVPDMFNNVLLSTKKLPCKRVAIIYNLDYLTDTIGYFVTMENMGIRDCIVPDENLEKEVKAMFSGINVHVVRPYIDEDFKPSDEKKLIVNLMSNSKEYIDSIIKPFFLKYPLYKWVAMRHVQTADRDEYVKALNDAVATIWVDSFTDFGYGALEAMAAGNIVIGKIPERIPSWIGTDNLTENGLWFYTATEAQNALARVIESYIHDAISPDVYNNMKKTVENFSRTNFENDVKRTYVDTFFENRKKELQIALSTTNNKEITENM